MTVSNAAAEIVVEGRVQGVGFRFFAQRRATLLGLAGYVANLKDGRVRLRVEGDRGLIADLIRDLEKGPPLSQVTRVTTRWRPATGRFRGFDIRYTEFDQ